MLIYFDATYGLGATNPYTVALQGTGTITPTRIIALSGNLEFGNVVVGASAQRTLTITNSGNSTLNVSGLSYPGGFSGNWPSGTIPAGGSQNVTATFSPTAAASYGGTVTVNSDKTIGTNTIAASGTGTTTSAQLSGLGLSSGVFFFSLKGPVGSRYVIQASANLVNWQPFATNVIPARGSVQISDSTTGQAKRFYRAVLVP